MKKDIHPEFYPDATVICSCGNTWKTGSTQKEIRTEVCSQCHPFFTGEQARLIDIEGQVDRFYKKLQAREDFIADEKRKQDEKTSPDRSVEELELGKRATDALIEAGMETVGKILERLEDGEAAMLDLPGIGRKTLIDVKKKLRSLGYKLPEAAEEITV
ncbi:MAG: large subunit ribosomal protein [Chloroflexota bacterium]|nr:large subunit ribosomal protein [Chloroflexota bacterium]